jgi:hypothetical protein
MLTRSSQPWAYFSLPTRAWELAAGALVALGVPALTRFARGPAAALAWTGLAVVVASSLAYTDASAFPGYLALAPVLGATAVIAAGCAGHRGGAEEVLRAAPMQWIGRYSYAWYLWHWPVLVVVPIAVGHELTFAQNLGVSAVSLVAAVVSFYVVENPIRSWHPLVARPARALGLGLCLTLVVLLTATLMSGSLKSAVPQGPAARLVVAGASPSGSAGFGEAVHAAVAGSVDLRDAPSNLTPSVANAAGDVPESQRDGCHQLGFDVVKPKTPCVYGDTSGHHTVVLYGDSHAAQWLPALDALGKQEHWRIASRTKVSCPATAVPVRNTALRREYSECDRWRRAAITEIATLHPDVVLIASAVSVGADDVTDRAWSAGTAQTVARFTAMGSAVVLLADTARTKAEGVDCLAAHLDDVRACRLPSGIAYYYPHRRAADMEAAKRAGALVIDPDPWFCARGWCPAVVGPFVVFRDSSHMTATYARWLAPAVLDQLLRHPATAKALGLG